MKHIARQMLLIGFMLPGLAQAQTQPAPIPQTSLFLSAQQVVAAQKLALGQNAAGLADIHLGAILFYDKDDWAVWLQGERWTPQTKHADLQITDVSTEQVGLLWRDENGSVRAITLRPHQTYDIANGRISQ